MATRRGTTPESVLRGDPGDESRIPGNRCIQHFRGTLLGLSWPADRCLGHRLTYIRRGGAAEQATGLRPYSPLPICGNERPARRRGRTWIRGISSQPWVEQRRQRGGG